MAIPVGSTSASASYVPKKKKKKPVGIGGTAKVGGVAPQQSAKTAPAAPPAAPQSPDEQFRDNQLKRAQDVLYQPGIPDVENIPSDEYLRHLKTPEQELQPVQSQTRNIITAYREVHGKDPSAAVLAMLLTSTGPNTSLEQYRDLLAPTGGAKWQVPGSAEIAVIKQKYDPATLLGWGADPDPGLHLGLTTGVGDPIGPLFNETASPYGTGSNLARLRSEALRREWGDKDRTWFERYEHDAITGRIYDLKNLLASRQLWLEKYMGQEEVLDFDRSTGEYDAGTDAAYRQITFMRQWAKYVYGNDKQRQEAYKVMVGDEESGEPGLIWDIHGLSSDGRLLVEKLKYLRSNIRKGILPSAAEKRLLYAGYVAGRPFGQSETKARLDFVNEHGFDNLPADAQALHTAEKRNLGDYIFQIMSVPFEASRKGSQALHDWLPEGHLGASEHTIADLRSFGIPEIKGLDWQAGPTDFGAYLGNVADVVNGIVQVGVAAVQDVPGAAIMGIEAKGVQLLNVLGLASGTHVLDGDGHIVPNPKFLAAMQEPEKVIGKERLAQVRGAGWGTGPAITALMKEEEEPGFDLDWGVLTSANAWAAARNTDQGKMLVRAWAEDSLLGMGIDASEIDGPLGTLYNTAIDIADLAGAIGLGHGVFKVAKYGGKKAGVAGYKATRATVRGLDRAIYEATEPGSALRNRLLESTSGRFNKYKMEARLPGGRRRDTRRMRSEDARRTQRLEDEYESIDAELTRDAESRLPEEPSARDPDEVNDYASAKRYILARGGIKAGDLARYESQFTPAEKRSASHGLVRRKQEGVEPQALDEVLREMIADNPGVPFEDVNSFWQWMDAQRAARGRAASNRQPRMSKSDTDAALKRLDEIEKELDDIESRYPQAEPEGKGTLPPDETTHTPRGSRAKRQYEALSPEERGEGAKPRTELHPDDFDPTEPDWMRDAPDGEAGLRYAYAMDEALVRTMHEYDVDLMPGDPLSEIAKVYEVLGPEADVKLYSHLADVLEERGLARSVPETPVAKTPAAETPTAESGPSVPVQQFTTRHGQQRWQVTPIPGEPRINAGGVRVREVVMRDGRRVEVDAGIADEVSRLDQGGYRPHQSHGFPDDHPKSHPTQKMGVEPYVEFVIGELDTVSKLRQAKLFDIKDAAAKTEVGYEYGKAVVNGKEVRTIIVRGQGLREFVNELLGAERRPPKAEGPLPPADEGGAGARPPADAVMAEAAAPQDAVGYPWWLRNKAETLALLTDPDLAWLVARLLKVPDEKTGKKAAVEAVNDIISSTDPARVAARIDELSGGEVDPSMPGLLYHLRIQHELKGAKTNWPKLFTMMSTYTAFSNDVPDRGTSQAMHGFATATNMGLEKMTTTEWRAVNHILTEIWKTDDVGRRHELVARLDDRVRSNMMNRPVFDMAGQRRHGKPRWTNEWEKYQHFVRTVYAMQAKTLLGKDMTYASHLGRRSYGPGDRPRANYSMIERARTEIDDLKKRYLEAADEGEKARLKQAIAEADAEILAMREDALILDMAERSVKGYKWDSPKVKGAAARWKERSPTPQPVYGFQLRKGITHADDIDPRLLAIYQAGPQARVFELSQSSRWNILYGNNITRMWKMLVLSSTGFPLRVNAGDEFWRLVPEGMAPGSPAFIEARAAMRDLLGARTLRGHREALEVRGEGTVGRGISDRLFDTMNADYVEAVVKDWALVGPNDGHPHYVPAFRDFFRQLMEEPHFKRWRDEGMPEFKDSKGRFDRIALEEFVEKALLESEEGRLLLLRTGRARARDGHFYPDRGALGDLVTVYADTMQKVIGSGPLRGAARKGKITRAEMNAAGEDLWSVPVSIGVERPWRRGPLGVLTPAGFYEKLTMPMLEAITYQLRGTFFSGFYLREAKRLKEEHPDWKSEAIHDAASERALDRVNQVTFTRNATILEDLGRNVLPFISSYRQFMVYWMRVFAKEPLAMGAAHAAAQNLGLGGWFGPFWMQEDKYAPEDRKKGVVGQSVPNVHPFVAYLVGRSTGWDTGIEDFPGMAGASETYQPLNILGNLYYAKTGEQLPMSRPIGTMQWRLRQYELHNLTYNGAPAGGGPATATVDGDWRYDLFKRLGFHDPLAADAWVRSRLSPKGGTAREIPEVEWKRDHDLAYEALNGAAEQAAYRAAHPKYDALLSLSEHPTHEERLRLLSRFPDLIKYEVGLYDKESQEGVDMTFEEMLRLGIIDIKDTRRIEQDYARAVADVFGGNVKVGDTTQPYGGDIARLDAEKKLADALKKAKSNIKKAALELSPGGKKEAKNLAERWIDKVENPRADRQFVVPPLLADWARRNKINPQSLNLGALQNTFDELWGRQPRSEPEKPPEAALGLLPGLAAVGVLSEQTAGQLIDESDYVADIKKAGIKQQQDNRKLLLDAKMEESFKLDSADLRRMGWDAGVAFDRAMQDVERFYYSEGEYGWYKQRGKSTTSEGREARNRYYAYRDKRMRRVKGGEAVIGGLTKTLRMDRYFSDPGVKGSFGYGKKAEERQKLWDAYVAETLKLDADPRKVLEYKRQFDPILKDRYEERMRVNDWLATIAMASYMRNKMKASWSDYYKGPGNSVYTDMGEKMVADLEKLMKSFYSDSEGKKRKGSLFYEDITTYFGDAHSLAYRMLEWYYH